jgi:hypothetical protein
MKMTPLQASNLKQEDNLRPKKSGQHSERYDRKRRSVRVFFSFLAADDLVADPLPRVRS